ncbi:hypothetical protein [Mesorhizobium sp. B263B2A]|uniref:hypothetical protein n=1 Tax=Mesorhizobium sp. B263B2A TaxID=2876669 RepID=UPI001CD1400B|nr:hypothetical protein [Mesorhizobium sp. B263B2A]MCA0032749.1 hypothetical protein [Mesorhizobium sp. B263B2A]
MTCWQPDRSLEGQTVVLIGGGPSHAAIDLALLKGHRFAAINSGCRKVRPIATDKDILYFTDNSWCEQHIDLIEDWPGPVICANRHSKGRLGDRVRYIDVNALASRIGGFAEHAQASSGHIMTCLVQDMGGARAILSGFECRAVDGRTHGHEDYNGLHDMPVFEGQFLPGWRGLAKVLTIDVVNATPGSAIDCFPFRSLEDCLTWRPMGSAPYDGSPIRSRETDYPFREKVVVWTGKPERFWGAADGNDLPLYRPLEWMPA